MVVCQRKCLLLVCRLVKFLMFSGVGGVSCGFCFGSLLWTGACLCVDLFLFVVGCRLFGGLRRFGVLTIGGASFCRVGGRSC